MSDTPSPAFVAPTLDDAILVVERGVATFTMNRDDVRNELTGTALASDIVKVVDAINNEPSISVLIVTGAGNAFSAGGNVKHMKRREGSFGGDVYTVQNKYRRGIQQIPLALDRLEVPSIAAINGPAIGAGFDLANMCDMRIAADTMVAGSTFVNLGIVPGDGGVTFLERLVGYQRAAELVFRGRLISAEEAQRLGIVLEVVPRDDLMVTALKYARDIAGKPPRTIRLTKRLLRSSRNMELAPFLDLCAAFQGMCHDSADHQEAVSAFLEKRAPHYSGR